MKENLLKKDGVQKLLASLLSILIGLTVGAIVVAIVGLTKENIGVKGMWDGIRLIFIGLLANGRDAAGNLAWGFNPTSWGNMLFRATPVVMTGLSVAVAFKTGLFNIGAPGQYLMGTMTTLMDHCVPGRYDCRCSVGCGSRPFEGIPQYQRGSCLHHDKLAGCQYRHLGL